MHNARLTPSPFEMPDEVRAAIDAATGLTGDTRRAYFAADIGNGYVDGTVEWKFLKGGLKSRWVRLPRAAFTHEREAGRNFWLVEMAAPLAEVFGIGEWVLDDDEVERHKERMNNALRNSN